LLYAWTNLTLALISTLSLTLHLTLCLFLTLLLLTPLPFLIIILILILILILIFLTLMCRPDTWQFANQDEMDPDKSCYVRCSAVDAAEGTLTTYFVVFICIMSA
jgi:hypothetical protein